jgi:hypothetical protein
MGFIVDEAIDPIALAEAIDGAVAMLPRALGKITRHADVKYAPRSARHHVNVIRLALKHVG